MLISGQLIKHQNDKVGLKVGVIDIVIGQNGYRNSEWWIYQTSG